MRLLLDTHAFLWLDTAPQNLSARVQSLCRDPQTILLLSVVSVWEIQIKSALGKLTLRLPLQNILLEQARANGLQILPITLAHVLALEGLPLHHKDPFDRLLIAQSLSENLSLVSADHQFRVYPAAVIW